MTVVAMLARIRVRAGGGVARIGALLSGKVRRPGACPRAVVVELQRVAGARPYVTRYGTTQADSGVILRRPARRPDASAIGS